MRLIRLLIDARRWAQAKQALIRAKDAAAELSLPVSAALHALEQRLATVDESPGGTPARQTEA